MTVGRCVLAGLQLMCCTGKSMDAERLGAHAHFAHARGRNRKDQYDSQCRYNHEGSLKRWKRRVSIGRRSRVLDPGYARNRDRAPLSASTARVYCVCGTVALTMKTMRLAAPQGWRMRSVIWRGGERPALHDTESIGKVDRWDDLSSHFPGAAGTRFYVVGIFRTRSPILMLPSCMTRA